MWRRAFVSAIALVLSLPEQLVAQELPDLIALREKIQAARGTMPAEYRKTSTLTTPEGATPITLYHRGDDEREIIGDGPTHTESGVRHGEAWHQNENGLTVIDEPEAGAASKESTKTTVSKAAAPLDAYVIATLNAGGYGRREFIDAHSYQVVRVERHTVNGDIVTTYDDFRRIGDATFAGHRITDDRVHGIRSEERVETIVRAAVSDDDLEVPAIRRRLVEFPPVREWWNYRPGSLRTTSSYA